jgi:hypothetical protein
MNDTWLAYFISLGIVGAGSSWIIAGQSMLCIGIGTGSIAVGAISLFKELRNGAH